MATIIPESRFHKYVKKIAKKLNADMATAFPGFVLNGYRVLYRRALFSTIIKGKHRYPRLSWLPPRQYETRVDFALLHAVHPDEMFFLIPAGKFDKVQPGAQRINISADVDTMDEIYMRRNKGRRNARGRLDTSSEKIARFWMSLAEVKSKLRK